MWQLKVGAKPELIDTPQKAISATILTILGQPALSTIPADQQVLP